MCGRTGMSWRRRSTPGSRTGSRGGDDRVCLRRGEGLRSFQGGRETWKPASWQPAGSRIRLPLKESDIPVAVNPKSADGPSNNPQCGFWDSQFSAAQVKSVEQPWFEQASTLVAVVELSRNSWLVAGVVPGIDRHPLKKLAADENELLSLLHRWKQLAVKTGREIKHVVDLRPSDACCESSVIVDKLPGQAPS